MTSICVVTMDRGEKLQQTLDAIFTYSVQPYEVIIIDNGSTEPRALEVLEGVRDRATIIRNETNLGLSIGTNQGLEAGQYDCLIHMDNDCLIRHSGWNLIMKSYFENPKIGMVAPYRHPLSINQGRYQELSWTLGLCWAIRKSLFDDIGGYDPQLLHQNECDISLRTRMAGYHVAGIEDFQAIHNDPGGPLSDLALARVNIGCVQFRDKWAAYYRGKDWTYGTDPIYLMQHWPPDQDFMRRFAVQEGLGHLEPEAQIRLLQGTEFMIFREARQAYQFDWWHNPGAHDEARTLVINRWHELTGDLYEGYKWPHNLLRPY